MKTVVTRCKSASVKINKKIVGSINEGLLVLVGFTYEANTTYIFKQNKMVDKIINLRIFNDNNNVMNKSALELNKQILSVSQFTLYADTKKGRRPSYVNALKSNEAIKLYDLFNEKLSKYLQVSTGVFGEDMEVESINDGPVTIILESR